MAYSREDIDEVRDKTDLVELAGEITKVKRSGRSTMAVCPFHSEKTPSLSIDGARGLYHCFGCGKSGDVYSWVRETQGLDFTEAVEFLARRAGVTLKVDPLAAKRRGERESLVEATEVAVGFYTARLKTAADAGPARSYLRGRGYDADVVETFSLGYSPDAWDELVKHMRGKGIADKAMLRSGLASRSRKGGLIDRFRGRVMFPIFDVRGDAVGFGARVLDGEGPKYLNSAESPIYHKSRLLYGLNWAKSEIVRKDTAVVVEGYTDVIAMHQAGMPVAVATCGTALGEEHLDLLRRFSERVVFAFDADEAGVGAALRGFDRSVPGDLDLRVAALPDGKDPADVVADGEIERLRLAVEESQPLLKVRIESEVSKFNLDEPEGRGKAVRAAVGVIALHPDPVVRNEYAGLVSRLTGVDAAVVRDSMRPARRSEQGRPADVAPSEATTATYRTESELLRVVLANDERLANVTITPDLFSNESTASAYAVASSIVQGLTPGSAPNLGKAIGAEDSPEGRLLRKLALDTAPIPDPQDLVTILERAKVDRRIEDVRRDLQKVDQSTDEQGYSELLQQLIALEQEKRHLRSDA